MKNNGGEFPLIDHRSIGLDTNLGGTPFCFESEAMPRDWRIRVRVVDDQHERSAMVEQLFGVESLFEVTYDYGARVVYDHQGNLQRLKMPVGKFFNNLDEESLEILDPEMIEAMAVLIMSGAEIVMDVDLREGLSDGSGTGWVYLTCDASKMREIFSGRKIGGFEVGPEVVMAEPYWVGLVDANKKAIGGGVNVMAEVRGDVLYVALGDGEVMVSVSHFLKIDPDSIDTIDLPTGALSFLGSLRPDPGTRV